jgi:hypothetical protein
MGVSMEMHFVVMGVRVEMRTGNDTIGDCVL